VYFGSKEDLFDIVIEQCLASAADTVPFDAVDLTGYAASLFDYLVANPESVRLTTWNQLERGGSSQASSAVYREMVQALADAQARREVDSALAPVDLLALVQALVRAWFVASPALQGAASGKAWSRRRIAEHRAAVVRAVDILAATDGTTRGSRPRAARGG
jgi:AcrR family transcriptional regulator